MILLDTHAVIWLAQGHHRARPLARIPRIHISPVTLLEIQFLTECGKVRMARGASVEMIADDPRWRLDEPPSGRWFAAACALTWTHDPFDRLLAAHCRVRGWKLATADALLIDHLAASEVLQL